MDEVAWRVVSGTARTSARCFSTRRVVDPVRVAVTAAIDVFVDMDKRARLLGRSDAKSTGLATAAGAASSACTFGAVTVA